MKNRRNTQNPQRHAKLLATGLAVLLLAPPDVDVRGQGMVSSGHALDANLRFGSGGYNGPVRGAGSFGLGNFQRGAYDAYRGGVDRRNAFMDERAYDPTRSSRGAVPRSRPQVRVAGAPRIVTTSKSSPSAGFDAAYDPAYETRLAAGTYESKTAQQQANALSYGIGFAIGERIRTVVGANYAEADVPSIIAGFRDAVHDTKAQMSDEEMEELLHALYERVTGVQTRERLASVPEFRAELERNEASGQRLRDRLARDAEVVTLDNGLQYRVLVEGTGPSPGPTDAVSVRYSLLSPDGDAVTEPARWVIFLRYSLEGVQIALTTMKVGSVWQVALPSSLAHGANGRPPLHGPGVTLYFEVELLAIN